MTRNPKEPGPGALNRGEGGVPHERLAPLERMVIRIHAPAALAAGPVANTPATKAGPARRAQYLVFQKPRHPASAICWSSSRRRQIPAPAGMTKARFPASAPGMRAKTSASASARAPAGRPIYPRRSRSRAHRRCQSRGLRDTAAFAEPAHLGRRLFMNLRNVADAFRRLPSALCAGGRDAVRSRNFRHRVPRPS